jgi:hypothetical protein
MRRPAGHPAGATAPSSSGLGRRPLKAVTAVRIRSGLPPNHPRETAPDQREPRSGAVVVCPMASGQIRLWASICALFVPAFHPGGGVGVLSAAWTRSPISRACTLVMAVLAALARRAAQRWRAAPTGRRGATAPSPPGRGAWQGPPQGRGRPRRASRAPAASGEPVTVADESGLVVQYSPRLVCWCDHLTLLRSGGGVASSLASRAVPRSAGSNVCSAPVNSTAQHIRR